jgi:hypothetical protein
MSTVVDLTVWRQKRSLRRIELGLSTGAQNVGDHRAHTGRRFSTDDQGAGRSRASPEEAGGRSMRSRLATRYRGDAP